MKYNSISTKEREYMIGFILIDGSVYEKDDWVDVNKETWELVSSIQLDRYDHLHPNDIEPILNNRLIEIGRCDLKSSIHGAYYENDKLNVYVDVNYKEGPRKTPITTESSKHSPYIWLVKHPNGKTYMLNYKGEGNKLVGVEVNEDFINELYTMLNHKEK